MSTVDPQAPGTQAEHDREFWRRMLDGGEFTALPRWCREPVSGVGEHVAKVPDGLVAALRRRADELAVSFPSVLLAAHARVLAAWTGERDPAIGYVAGPDPSPLPLRMTTEPVTWRALLEETHRIERTLRSHAAFQVADLERELGITRPAFEVVFDPAVAPSGRPAGDAILRVGIAEQEGVALRLQYRTDALDAECAARIAGYHLAALASIAADPETEHARQSLLSSGELQFQLDGLAGPRVDLPERRVHELFEERVRAHPDAVAAVHGERRWTYRQLNGCANQVARALRSRGLGREGVVAVVTERNLGWMAAVLGIFKAGGAYLPIEPHFPADRIAKMLSRAGCRFVLTEHGSTATLDRALETLPGVRTLNLDDDYEEDLDDGDPGVRVDAGQLAYIYFTSGSTGEPKGVMCEHAGMLNHVLAKIHDFGIGERDVVAQTAPQCFDISLWQLLSAVVAGGRTLLVEQEAILDAERFLDRIVGGKAAIVQLVPSYLEVVLSCLALHPRPLPDLRCVSVTGEAVKKELVERWFAIQPAIRLVNAYGLTETSDDTNHEVMERAPDRDRVPLGRPIRNARVYVVDEHLTPVPLGAPGEIVFSGVCVGRGYINDPERTQRVFTSDPHRPGQRLYRSGDFGRWLPDGKLEFLGRRDAQVKVSGFRIEIGDIENSILRLPGVRDGAVVVAGNADHTRRLVAFYTAERPLDAGSLRAQLGESLPAYMVPSAIHWRRDLPLTGNGKIDRKILGALAGDLEVGGQEDDGPVTATEQRVAAAWAEVLGLDTSRIRRNDHFFDLGGTSLSAVKLAIALNRAVSLEDLREHPVLAGLAARIEGRGERVSGRRKA